MEFVAFRYMTQFRCIADKCEDTCCGNWRVMIDEPSLLKLEGKLPASERADKIVRQPGAAQSEVKMRADGSCSFLDAEKLCSIQTRFGEPYIPTACAVYPRHVNQIGERTELSGALSCPEVTRLAFASDDAMELVDFEPAILTREHRAKVIEPSSDPYVAFCDDVRAALMSAVAQRAYPLATRLAVCAQIADTVGGYFHRGASSSERLAADFGAIASPQLWKEVHEQLGAQKIPGEPTAQFIAAMLKMRRELPHTPRLGGLIERVLATYGEGAAQIWARFCERRAALESRHSAALDRYFTHYCVQFWFRELYTDSENLMAHLRSLLIRVAALRFLLVGHPDALTAGDLSPIAVEVFETFARGVEHEVEFLKIVHQSQASGGDPFARALLLLKFC